LKPVPSAMSCIVHLLKSDLRGIETLKANAELIENLQLKSDLRGIETLMQLKCTGEKVKR